MSPLRTCYIHVTYIHETMDPKAMGSAMVGGGTENAQLSGALFSSSRIVSFDSPEKTITFATKVRDCVLRALDAIGSSRTMRQAILWNLLATKKIGLAEVADEPTEFMEGIRAIFGEAGADVFEFMLVREVKREFGLRTNTGPPERKSLGEVLQYAGLEI